MQIDHIAIWTSDLEIEKDFYLTYFDCTVNDKYKNPQKQYSSYFLTFSNGARIELMKRNDISEKSKIDVFGFAHIAINVGSRSNVDSLTSRIETDGFTVHSYPRITGDGYYESVILDPENNKIEIMSR